jgi:hypothetical protein
MAEARRKFDRDFGSAPAWQLRHAAHRVGRSLGDSRGRPTHPLPARHLRPHDHTNGLLLRVRRSPQHLHCHPSAGSRRPHRPRDRPHRHRRDLTAPRQRPNDRNPCLTMSCMADELLELVRRILDDGVDAVSPMSEVPTTEPTYRRRHSPAGQPDPHTRGSLLTLRDWPLRRAAHPRVISWGRRVKACGQPSYTRLLV